jgi:hypothetical protein
MKFIDKGSWFMGKRYVGEVDGYFIEAQVFSEPSHYGIAKGKISRLTIYPDRSAGFSQKLANYDRGWDGGPPKGMLRTVVEKVVNYFDHKQVDWTFEASR